MGSNNASLDGGDFGIVSLRGAGTLCHIFNQIHEEIEMGNLMIELKDDVGAAASEVYGIVKAVCGGHITPQEASDKALVLGVSEAELEGYMDVYSGGEQ